MSHICISLKQLFYVYNIILCEFFYILFNNNSKNDIIMLHERQREKKSVSNKIDILVGYDIILLYLYNAKRFFKIYATMVKKLLAKKVILYSL